MKSATLHLCHAGRFLAVPDAGGEPLDVTASMHAYLRHVAGEEHVAEVIRVTSQFDRLFRTPISPTHVPPPRPARVDMLWMVEDLVARGLDPVAAAAGRAFWQGLADIPQHEDAEEGFCYEVNSLLVRLRLYDWPAEELPLVHAGGRRWVGPDAISALAAESPHPLAVAYCRDFLPAVQPSNRDN